MDRAVFDRMAEQDQVHWWYVARRRILADLIAREVGPAARRARILEIGCGTGHNFEMLRRFGRSTRSSSTRARALWPARGLAMQVGDAPLPALAGVADGAYDLIALLDVLEHVDGDRPRCASIAGQARAGRADPGHRARLSVDVERARRRPPSQAALFEAGPARGDRGGRPRRFAPDRLFQQPALPDRRRGRASPASSPARRRATTRCRRRRSTGCSQAIFGLERHLVGAGAVPGRRVARSRSLSTR